MRKASASLLCALCLGFLAMLGNPVSVCAAKGKPKSNTKGPSKGIEFSGYAQERGSRDPLEGAPVYLLGAKKKYSQVTDARGFFKFEGVRPGRYRLVIPVPNYRPFKQKVEIKKDKSKSYKEQNFFLIRIGEGQFEHVTRAKRRQQEVHKQTLQREEITIIPGTQGDPLKVVQNLPGVARTPLNTGFFIIRGSAPEDSRVYVDGHQIPQLYHFGGLTAVINGDMARSIDLLPGGFSVAYGRATGGVIHLQTREAQTRWHGYLDIDLIDVGFLLEGPLWKGASILLSARRSHIDAVLGLVLPKDNRAFDLTVAPVYYDYQLKLSWRVNKAHFLSLMFYGSDDVLGFVREQPVGRGDIRGEFSLHSLFHRMQFLWQLKPAPWISHDFNAHFGFSLNSIKGGTALNFDTGTWVFSLRDELRIQFRKNLLFRAGIDMVLRSIDLSLRVPSNIPREEDPPGSQGGDILRNITQFSRTLLAIEPALYAELDWQIIPAIRAIFGVRGDYTNFTNEFVFNPRFSMVWTTPHKPLSFRGTIGLFSQPPQLQETFPEFGNPNARAEHAVHYTVGTNYNFTSYLSAEVTFYYKQMFNLIVSSRSTVVRDGQEVPERLNNNGFGSSYGVEMTVRHRPYGRFFGWITYTLGRSERVDNPLQPSRLFSFDQTHILTVVFAAKLGAGFTASARFRLVSGNPYTPNVGGIFDADSGSYFPIPGQLYSARNPLFHQLDLRLDYKLTFTRWKLMFYVDVQNVYNAANQEGTISKYDYSATAPLTGIPIFPSLGIKGEF